MKSSSVYVNLLILLFFSAVACNAQNFGNIATPGTTYFQRPGDSIRGYRYDEVTMAAGDSVFHAPPTIARNPDQYSCSDTLNGPVLSRMIRKKADGWFVFQDINSDSTRFFSLAGLNESWVCRMLPGNARLRAKVTSIGMQSFLGVTDLVKEITFQAEDAGGVPLAHDMNGKKALLSQHHGFIRTPDWNRFPADTAFWELAGKGSPAIGLQDFSVAECYDFQPGDIFHYDYYQRYNTGAIIYIDRIRTVISRTSYGDDSVSYVYDECKVITYPIPPPNTEKRWDTVSETIVFADQYFLDFFNPVADRFMPVSYNENRASRFFRPQADFNGRPVKGCSPGDYCRSSDCWIEICFEDFYSECRYAVGLGRYYFRDSGGDPGFTNYYSIDELVYYKKGGEEWGVPLAQDCHILLSEQESPSTRQLSVKVIPNPVTDRSVVVVEGCGLQPVTGYILLDLAGRKVQEGRIEGNTWVLSRDGLEKGCYFLIVVVDENKPLKPVKVFVTR